MSRKVLAFGLIALLNVSAWYLLFELRRYLLP